MTARDTFERANRLWFREGRTAAALSAYEDALREAPEDPVLAFQFARALWSVDRFDEARSLLEQARSRRDRLNTSAQSLLETWRALLNRPWPERPFPALSPKLLDRDQLESGSVPIGDWRTIADAAQARRMYGLATYALSRWEGVPIDAEEAKDIDHIESNLAIDENILDQMYADSGQVEDEQPDEVSAPVQNTPETLKPTPSPTRVSPGAPLELRDAILPSLPLTLSLRVEPVEGPVGAVTTLTASLSNPTEQAQVVNRRMLVNHMNSPGEIWLDVKGPQGYLNKNDFRIRAGTASNEFFVSLPPGKSVEQSWILNDYESLDKPGDYLITFTYHNENPKTPDRRPMAVGKAVGSVRIHRY